MRNQCELMLLRVIYVQIELDQTGPLVSSSQGEKKKPQLGSFAVCPQQKIGGNYFLGMSLTYLIQINKSVANASEKLIFTSCEAITFLTCF